MSPIERQSAQAWHYLPAQHEYAAERLPVPCMALDILDSIRNNAVIVLQCVQRA